MAVSNSLKKFKLKVHQSNFSEESLVLNAKDFPDVREDDIVKISSCDGDPSSYLVIKVKSLKKGELQKETVSIEQTIATRFGLHAFQSVHVTKVDPLDISLDMLEVTFKDQYISRSDMWRLKKHLVGSCTCLDEKIEYSDIRAQVSDLWIDSNKVKCGLITDFTRIVLRSASALVYIFIQMSSEMWDFDAYGRLNFERAVNGFLKDLFTKWKDKCYHEITLVLFSRTFYKTKNIDDFPDETRGVVQQDYRGRCYIDFYNCVAHHERSDDCTPSLFVLQKLFNEYKDLIKIPGCPAGSNSASAEGNFLEAINMPLNVFEKHYLDRNFDRTGQLVMCITPGVGVFDVDRDLTVLTKERMIDNGIGSDLICLGQQPLHAVPLFKFHKRARTEFERAQDAHHDFNIPHWLNHSFYLSNPFPDTGTTGIKYIPRIHLAQRKSNTALQSPSQQSPRAADRNQYPAELPSYLEVEYEEFDRKIFSLPRTKRLASSSLRSKRNTPKRSTSTEVKKVAERIRTISDEWRQQCSSPEEYSRQRQTDPLHIPSRQILELAKFRSAAREASSVGAAANLEKYLNQEHDPTSVLIVGSAHSLQMSSKQKHGSRRALINPFVASYTLTPLTSNRRRWVHTLPRADTYKPRRLSERTSESSSNDICEEDSPVNSNGSACGSRGARPSLSGGDLSLSIVGSANSSEMSFSSYAAADLRPLRATTDMGGKKFPHLPVVDWKALRSPACLPITNDYFPSKLRLQNEYTEQSYNLIPDHDEQPYDMGTDSLLNVDSENSGRQTPATQQVTTREIFLELVNQRLCQGFQLVVRSRSSHRRHYDSTTSYTSAKSPSSICGDLSYISTGSASPVYSQCPSEMYTLNHGRQYHVVTLTSDNQILVKVYKPRHPFLTATIEYKYLLWAVSRDKYRMAKVKFSHEQYESYYWNYQDNYVCCGGADSDFRLTSNIKYWRSKFIIIPTPVTKLKMHKSETEAAAKEGRQARFDIFKDENSNVKETLHKTCDGFVRFLDHINKIRRHPSSAALRRPWVMKSTGPSATGSLPPGFETIGGTTPASTAVQSSQTPPANKSSPASGRSTPVPQVMAQTSPPVLSSNLMHADAGGKSPGMPVQTQGGDQSPSSVQSQGGKGDEVSDTQQKHLNAMSEAHELIAAMRHKDSGFVFLPHLRGLHSRCFLSIEAVQWCILNVDGVEEISGACKLFQRLCDGRYVCHASGDCAHPFIYGYYLYFLTDGGNTDGNDLADPSTHQYDTNNEARTKFFRDQWLEIEIKIQDEKDIPTGTPTTRPRHKSALSSLLEKDAEMRKDKSAAITCMKTVLLPMNNRHKTARTEWCQLQYPQAVTPWRGMMIMSFNMEWMVATATCLFEMLQGWSREASRCHLCMLPAPNNPFAFPHTERDASPLHCPLFIPVNFTSLLEVSTDFQDVYKKGMECRKRIIYFMEKVATKFGFARYTGNQEPDAERNNISNSRQFVHFTGQAFLEIPVTDDYQVQGRSLATKQKRVRLDSGQEGTHTTPSRLISPKNKSRSGFNVEQNDEDDGARSGDNLKQTEVLVIDLKSAGFYFSANHLLTKRWRTVAIGAFDDCPIRKLEADFIRYCADSDNRLIHYYKSCYS